MDEKLINTARLNSYGFKLWERVKALLNTYVHQTRENMIIGKTVLFDGYVAGAPLVTVDNPGAVHNMNNNTSYFVCTNLLVSANQKVGQITIGVNSNKQVGEVVTGVNIGAIKRSNHEVLDYVITNGIGIVHENTDGRLNCDKAITVDVDVAWTEDVYIMVGAHDALWGPRNNIYGGNAVGGGTLPSVGSTLSLNTGNYVGRVIIYGDVVALRDLGGSGGSGVSRGEFDQHVAANEQQHQTFTSNISTITQSVNTANQNITNLSSRVDNIHTNVTSQGERIVNLESNAVKSNTQNTFTSKNVFMENSPIVNKYFSIKNIVENNATDVPYDKSTYCCNPKQGIGANVHISAILVPIHDSRPGDRIEAAYFVVNADTQRVVGDVPNLSTYTVQDIQYKGHYCIAFEVNRTFSHSVAFGFSVRETLFGGRRIRLLKQNANSNAWTSHLRPSNNEVLNHNDTFLIPYAITRRASSEVVTRFDLANNTVPTGNYRVGELKMLVYDAGENTEIGGYTWLRCDGQTVSSGDYSELYDTIGFQFNTSSEYTIRPLNDDGTDVSVDFNLPTNQNVGYLYICAK